MHSFIICSLPLAPHISIEVSGSSTNPAVGQSYSLNCNVSGAESIPGLTTTYHWTKNNSVQSQVQVGNNSEMLFFILLRLSDAGAYSCTVIVTSSLLTLNITATSSVWNLILQSELHDYEY